MMIVIFSLLFTAIAADDQGWIQVEAGAAVNFNLLTSPLEIKSSSGAGSNQEMGVMFSSGNVADRNGAILTLSLTASPSYMLIPCHGKLMQFDVEMPSADTYIWRISLQDSTEGARQLFLHCNDIEMVHFVIDDVCQLPTILNGDVAQIQFTENEAAEFYRAYNLPEPTKEVKPEVAPPATEPSKSEDVMNGQESVGEGAKNVGDEVEEKVKDESTENENKSERTILSWTAFLFCSLLGITLSGVNI